MSESESESEEEKRTNESEEKKKEIKENELKRRSDVDCFFGGLLLSSFHLDFELIYE